MVSDFVTADKVKSDRLSLEFGNGISLTLCMSPHFLPFTIAYNVYNITGLAITGPRNMSDMSNSEKCACKIDSQFLAHQNK